MARSGFVSLLPFFFPSPLLDASRLTLIVLFATLGSLLASGSTSAAGYPEPKQPYSADLTMRLSDGSGNEQYTSRGSTGMDSPGLVVGREMVIFRLRETGADDSRAFWQVPVEVGAFASRHLDSPRIKQFTV